MIVIVDYGRGNLFSLSRALDHVNAEHEITTDPVRIAAASKIILPGVGAFGDAMAALRRLDLVKPLKDAAARGVPLLGICLGMQMLVDESEEFGLHDGLRLIPGRVQRLRAGTDTRIPNVGWRRLAARNGSHLMADWPDDAMVYFVHSYAALPEDPADIVAFTRINGADVPAIIRRGSVVGYQFHPEKSGTQGLRLLARFLEKA